MAVTFISSGGKPKAKPQTTKLEKKPGKGTTSITWPDGSTTEQSESFDPKVFSGPMCNVGVNVAQTINMGNYNSIKIGVDVHIPCKETDLDATFKKAQAWVDSKMEYLQSLVFEAKQDSK